MRFVMERRNASFCGLYVEPISQKMKNWLNAVKEWFGAVVEKVKNNVKPSEKEETTERDPVVAVQPCPVTV